MTADAKLLGKLAGHHGASYIARRLKRTEAAVRFKAFTRRTRLALR
jgi:hypothetical protein